MKLLPEGTPGTTLSHYAAAESKKIDTIRLLHSYGANLESRDEDGYTPLVFAISIFYAE